jgi:hypothetical protein
MKRLIVLMVALTLALPALAQENRREQRQKREKEKAEEISKLIGSRNLSFIAHFAHPMSGGSIHLTSEYSLDIEGEKLSAWLPFFGRAYHAEYGGRDGGIKFTEVVLRSEWKSEKKGYLARFEVKSPNDIYRMNLSVTPAGYATLDVTSNNRQPIRFSGIVVKKKTDEE